MNDGKKFEQEVADAFIALGYKVNMDVLVAQKQVDMIISMKTPGITNEVKIYVECKDYDKSNLQSEDIDKFSYAYSRAKKEIAFTGGILVTRKPLNARVKASMNDPELTTITLSHLKDEYLGILSLLQKFISTYNSDGENKTYIPLKYQEGKVRKDLFLHTLDWLNSEESLLVLLGDFGTGKSTYLKRLKYELSQRYINSESNSIPLYIPLKNFDSYVDAESFFENQLKIELSRSLRFEEFSKISRHNDFIILLDGFDEMGLHIDSEKRKKHFKQLIEIISRANKTILTCRPAYFLSKYEMQTVLDIMKPPLDIETSKYSSKLRKEYSAFSRRVFSAITNEKENINNEYYSVLRLSGFSPEDIDDYLCKFYPDENYEYRLKIRERIRNTYDLEDLAKRPILLFLIANSLPQLSEDKEATPALIYLIYTSAWMERDWKKGEFRRLITPDKKINFVCHLAWLMYEKNLLELSYQELPTIIQEYFLVNGKTYDAFVTHIQSCAFLNRDDCDVFRFSHKSFMEYFAAQHISRNISKNGDFGLFESVQLSNEVSFFLGDMCYVEPELLAAIESKFLNVVKLSSPASIMLKSNLLSVYSKSRRPFPKTKIYNLHFYKLEFLKNSFSSLIDNCIFEISNFNECSFKDLELQELSSINSTIRKKSNLRNVQFYFTEKENSLKLENCRLNDVTFKGHVSLSLKECNIISSVFMHSKRLDIDDSEIFESKFDVSNLGGEQSRNLIKQSLFINSSYNNIGKRTAHSGGLRIKNVTFSNCIFVLVDFSVMNLEKCKFKNCRFLGCCFNYLDNALFASGMEFEKCEFLYSSISFSSWHEAERNKLEVRTSEYHQELDNIRNLSRSNESQYAELYRKLLNNPPQLPHEPARLSNKFLILFEEYMSRHQEQKIVYVDESSLPYVEELKKDVKWIDYGENILSIFARYLNNIT